VLFVAWLISLGNFFNFPTSPVVPDVDSISNTVRTKTNVVVRRQNFTWEQVESDDYVTYIQNLRAIGCPEATIRDIIVADVNALYAHRRATEIVSADHEWWRSEPDIDAVQKASEKLKSLESERRALLTRLLGPNWEIASNPLPPSARTGISLTGPILGDLPAETKQQVYDIAARTQEKMLAYQNAQQQAGKDADPMELAKFRQESRAELAKVLNPAQMEEFLLRYSETATRMRSELHGLNLSPDEFRNLFRVRDSIEQQPEYFYAGDDAVMSRRKRDLNVQVDAAMKQSLGADRYATYKLNQDPVYRESQITAAQYGAPPALVMPIYQINQLTEAERQRIRNDNSLSDDEKLDALAEAQAEQEKSLQKILSPEVLQQYSQPTNAAPQ
jgi:hypothetical protein